MFDVNKGLGFHFKIGLFGGPDPKIMEEGVSAKQDSGLDLEFGFRG